MQYNTYKYIRSSILNNCIISPSPGCLRYSKNVPNRCETQCLRKHNASLLMELFQITRPRIRTHSDYHNLYTSDMPTVSQM